MSSEKAALVTGATSGFGAAIARAFAAEGWRVIGTGRRSERLEALRSELGEHFWPLAFDVRSRAAMETALARIPVDFQPI